MFENNQHLRDAKTTAGKLRLIKEPKSFNGPVVEISKEFIEEYVLKNKQFTRIDETTSVKYKYAITLATYKNNAQIIDAFNEVDCGFFGTNEQTQHEIISVLDKLRSRYKFIRKLHVNLDTDLTKENLCNLFDNYVEEVNTRVEIDSKYMRKKYNQTEIQGVFY